MKLADFLYQENLTPTQFARMIGVKSRSTLYRYMNGDRFPSREMLHRIKIATRGQVLAEDFMDDSPPECAVWVRDADRREYWVTVWSRRAQRPPEEEPVEHPPLEPQHSEPVERALDVLGERARYDGRAFVLDGRPTDARGIIRAANAVLANRGEAPIRYPGL